MGKKKIHTEEEATLQSLVGPSTYGVWVDMLKILGPGGRTHRLAPLVAGMLQYAAERAGQRSRGGPRHGSVAAALLNASEHEEDGMLAGDLAKLVERLYIMLLLAAGGRE